VEEEEEAPAQWGHGSYNPYQPKRPSYNQWGHHAPAPVEEEEEEPVEEEEEAPAQWGHGSYYPQQAQHH